MITLLETKDRVNADPTNWLVALMDFVDDFRYHKDPRAVAEPFALTDRRLDAVLASTAEALCDELGIAAPDWLAEVPAAPEPYFVGGLENLKAISLVECPWRVRIRKVFVLENFLSRA